MENGAWRARTAVCRVVNTKPNAASREVALPQDRRVRLWEVEVIGPGVRNPCGLPQQREMSELLVEAGAEIAP